MAERVSASEWDVIIVGAGAAGLAAALTLAGGRDAENGSPRVLVLERQSVPGGAAPPGGLLDTGVLDELWPSWRDAEGVSVEPVRNERFVFLTRRRALELPWQPGTMRRGRYEMVGAAALVRAMAAEAVARGVEIAWGCAATGVIECAGAVAGVRVAAEVEAGGAEDRELHAPLVLLADGAGGALSRMLVEARRLDETRNPALFAAALHEVWRSDSGGEPGRVTRAAGWPFASGQHGAISLEERADGTLRLMLSVGLDGPDPAPSPLRLIAAVRNHPHFAPRFAEATLLRRTAGVLPEGGYWAMPKLACSGALLLGDAAGLFDPARLGGWHLAFESGRLAGKAAMKALHERAFDSASLLAFDRRVRDGMIGRALYASRNFRQAHQRGRFGTFLHTAALSLSGGRGFRERYPTVEPARRRRRGQGEPGAECGEFAVVGWGEECGELGAGSVTRVPNEICATRCAEEYGQPCVSLCPAEVFEARDGAAPAIDAARCVGCGICVAGDPYGVLLPVP